MILFADDRNIFYSYTDASYLMEVVNLELNKNALSSVESCLLGDEFCCQRPRCCYTTFSFGIQNECCMS